MIKSIPSTTLRDNLADVIEAVEGKEKYLVVTRSGQPRVALVNLDFFEDLLAANSAHYLTSIKKARKQYEKGEIFSHEEVFGEL